MWLYKLYTKEIITMGTTYCEVTPLSYLDDYEVYEAYESLKHIVDNSVAIRSETMGNYVCAKDEVRKRYNTANSIVWPHQEIPYFSDLEVKRILGYNTPINGEKYLSSEEYRTKITELFNQLHSGDEDGSIRKEIIKLGWNPEIEYNENTKQQFRPRIEEMYTFEINKYVFVQHYKKKDGLKYTDIFVCPSTGKVTMDKHETSLIVPDNDTIINEFSIVLSEDFTPEYEFRRELDKLSKNYVYYPFVLPSQVIASRVADKIMGNGYELLNFEDKPIIFMTNAYTINSLH